MWHLHDLIPYKLLCLNTEHSWLELLEVFICTGWLMEKCNNGDGCHLMWIFLDGCLILASCCSMSKLHIDRPSCSLMISPAWPTIPLHLCMVQEVLLCKYEPMKNVLSEDAGEGKICGCNILYMLWCCFTDTGYFGSYLLTHSSLFVPKLCTNWP